MPKRSHKAPSDVRDARTTAQSRHRIGYREPLHAPSSYSGTLPRINGIAELATYPKAKHIADDPSYIETLDHAGQHPARALHIATRVPRYR